MPRTITPAELPRALEGFEGLTTLSLDCFDTLLWRDTHAPVHVFTQLPLCTLQQRVQAEGEARLIARNRHGRGEVCLTEIYAELLPNAAPSEREEAIAAELALEAEHCFAFAPTVELMRAAKAAGLQVVIVSDTYCSVDQLRGLIMRAAGIDVAGLIDRVYCSSQIGRSKAEGMFDDVLKKLKVAPDSILHIGDNPVADYDGATRAGITALHLEQFTKPAKKRLRLEASMAAMVRGPHAETVHGAQPHRAALAVAEPQCADAAHALGLTTLGPLFHAYELWLQEEAKALATQHAGKVHWLFLMRDGHLPREVHHMSGGDLESSHAAEISRYTATAAALAKPGAIKRHVEREFGLNPPTLARQVLFTQEEIARLKMEEDGPETASHALLSDIRHGTRQKQLARRAGAFADRLIAHVKKLCDPQTGDVLMLVDLGYNGTVQNRIDGLLQDRLGVHVAGRYLLLREKDCPGLDKTGLFSTQTHDPQLLEAMCANVAVLEQLCTASMGSVVDYEEDGTPIRRANDIKERQSVVRDGVQAGALDFVRTACGPLTKRGSARDNLPQWRDAASAALLRLMFLPMPDELSVIADFEHDVNLGSERTVPLFDHRVAQAGLRTRGLFYMKGSERMYLPAELSQTDMSVRLSLFAQRRFGLDFTYTDFAEECLPLPAIFLDGEETSQSVIEARPTHDGFYVAALPIGANAMTVALPVGRMYSHIELASVETMPVAHFLKGEKADTTLHSRVEPVLDGMDEIAPGLLQCDGPEAMLVIEPDGQQVDEPMLVAVTFRPTALRQEVAAEIAPRHVQAA